MKTLLITQCLQNDFVKPIGKYDNLPNLLHIGYDESRRLMGLNSDVGPISLFMNWVNTQSEIDTIHIRDWHNPNDPIQHKHLEEFGDHCIENTPGADFVFKLGEKKNELLINATGLNDFIGTQLDNCLRKVKDEKVRIGIIGAWTEAKVTFLAYDIHTRYPQFDIAVCSALTASSSVHNHYTSLDQLRKLLNIHVFNSIGEFSNFLSWNKQGLEISAIEKSSFPLINFNSNITINDTDLNLIRYVFRGSKSVQLNILDGGFSGNLVLGTESVDLNGHSEASHVLKIGEQEAIGKERMSFEKVEQVLGNNAPRITDFADSKGRGILKYRYASMGKGNSTSFQKLFLNGAPLEKIENFLTVIFKDQLGKFYSASTYEKLNLFKYYGFDSASLGRIQKNIDNVYGKSASTDILEYDGELKFPNPISFYKSEVPALAAQTNTNAFLVYVHGDLNGANIVIDAQDNVWIIDFFHTHRGHILKDLIKLENDLLYIYTPINNEEEFNEALKISNVLFATKDLAKALPAIDKTGIKDPAFIRTYETIKMLRSFYSQLIKSDRNPTQLFIAQLRYSMHTLVFEESNSWQKRWALYNSGNFCEIIKTRVGETGKLRIDMIPEEMIDHNVLGLTILPGRKDFSRSLEEDIREVKRSGINVIIPLLTLDEMDAYGVPELLEIYKKHKFEVKHLAIVDQRIPSHSETKEIIDFINYKFSEGKKVLLHCVGGLGRSGLIAATLLSQRGHSAKDSIEIVRRIRSPRAIETKEQEDFIINYYIQQK